MKLNVIELMFKMTSTFTLHWGHGLYVKMKIQVMDKSHINSMISSLTDLMWKEKVGEWK